MVYLRFIVFGILFKMHLALAQLTPSPVPINNDTAAALPCDKCAQKLPDPVSMKVIADFQRTADQLRNKGNQSAITLCPLIEMNNSLVKKFIVGQVPKQTTNVVVQPPKMCF